MDRFARSARPAGIATLALLLSAPPGPASHPPAPDEITIGAEHQAEQDATRFFTNRAGAALPLPEETDAFMFAVFGDRTGGPADGVKILAQAVADVNLIEPDLVMTVGDLVEGYNTTDRWMAQMREFRGIMDDLLCPWFPVAGNHDIYWRGPGRPAEEHERHFEIHFGPLWYAFAHKNCGFIVLHTDEGDPATGVRTFEEPAAQRMSPEQFTWLESALERTGALQHVFVFCHHPRWLKGHYGDDWDRVHRVLAAAGNVRAVFAGHIHVARYDGRVDGIEYVTLATVGGSQSGLAPEAGYLHHFNLVTVRPTQIALSMLPVGEVMDVRAVTGEVSAAARTLASFRPRVARPIHLAGDGRVAMDVEVRMTNPVDRPVDLTLVPDSDDSRWQFSPDHAHAVLQPGATRTFRFGVHRAAHGIDAAMRLPVVRRQVDYLAEGARFAMPEVEVPLPLDVDLEPPAVPSAEHALEIEGDHHLVIASDEIDLPDGPLTLECWFCGDDFTGRRGLVTKTENSEYGFFVSNGVPDFSIHLGGAYVTVRADSMTLDAQRWYHIAGVFDGAEARLYIDGRLRARQRASGARTRSGLPLIVGADVDGRGQAMSHFDGLIDAVRLSSTARYAGDRFDPDRRWTSDRHTLLLLDMDARRGPWVYDGSGHGSHPIGTGAIVPVTAGND